MLRRAIQKTNPCKKTDPKIAAIHNISESDRFGWLKVLVEVLEVMGKTQNFTAIW
jgi:hypothetical protein